MIEGNGANSYHDLGNSEGNGANSCHDLGNSEGDRGIVRMIGEDGGGGMGETDSRAAGNRC